MTESYALGLWLHYDDHLLQRWRNAPFQTVQYASQTCEDEIRYLPGAIGEAPATPLTFLDAGMHSEHYRGAVPASGLPIWSELQEAREWSKV